MNTYNVPRNVKGEGRILFIFSTKALIYTAIGVGIGFVFELVLGLLGMGIIGYIIMGILGLTGFCIGTFKMPDTNAFKITRATGGENIDDVIKRYFLFKKNKNKIFVSTMPEVKKVESKKEGGKKHE